jgi:hypothetical protein
MTVPHLFALAATGAAAPPPVIGLVGIGADVTATAGSPRSVDIPYPSEPLVAGYIAVIHINAANGPGFGGDVSTSWTSIGSGTRGQAFWKLLDGTETGTVSATDDANIAAFMSVWGGLHTTSPVVGFAAGANTGSSTMKYPTITPSAQPSVVFAQGNGFDNGGTVATPTGTNPTFAYLGGAEIGSSAQVEVWYGDCTSTSALGARDTANTGWGNFYNGLVYALRYA